MINFFIKNSITGKSIDTPVILPMTEEELRSEIEDILEAIRREDNYDITYNELEIEDYDYVDKNEMIYDIEGNDLYDINKELIFFKDLTIQDKKIVLFLLQYSNSKNMEDIFAEISDVDLFENTTMEDIINDYKNIYDSFKDCPRTIKRYVEGHITPGHFQQNDYYEMNNDVFYYE